MTDFGIAMMPTFSLSLAIPTVLIALITFYYRNITDRKQALEGLRQVEAALRESQRKLTSLIDSLPGIVFSCANDSDYSMRYLSEGCLALTGYKSEELLGNSYNSINHAEDLPKVLAAIEAAIAKKQPYVVEYRIYTKLGQEKWLWEKGNGVFDSNGKVLGFEGFISDITELKQAESAVKKAHDELEIRVEKRTTELSNVNKQLQSEIVERKRAEEEIKKLNEDLKRRAVELEAANKELEAFSYSVSHDLRAPLRAINGFSRILLNEYAPQLAPEAGRYLLLVRDNAQQMGCLVDDILTFSRLGRSTLKKQLVYPEEIVRQVLTNLRDEQQNRQIEMLLGNLPTCQADSAMLKQVWVNLLTNALKFTCQQEVARIEVGYQQINSNRVYFVKDNGVGFDMQYAHKLFGVFQRLHRAEEYEGTGVGLAIVQRIVHRHGGRVWASAEGIRTEGEE